MFSSGFFFNSFFSTSSAGLTHPTNMPSPLLLPATLLIHRGGYGLLSAYERALALRRAALGAGHPPPWPGHTAGRSLTMPYWFSPRPHSDQAGETVTNISLALSFYGGGFGEYFCLFGFGCGFPSKIFFFIFFFSFWKRKAQENDTHTRRAVLPSPSLNEATKTSARTPPQGARSLPRATTRFPGGLRGRGAGRRPLASPGRTRGETPRCSTTLPTASNPAAPRLTDRRAEAHSPRRRQRELLPGTGIEFRAKARPERPALSTARARGRVREGGGKRPRRSGAMFATGTPKPRPEGIL